MARSARIEYEGAFFHVMNRGNRIKAIFIDYQDRDKFYEIMGNIERRYKIIIYSFVLMFNHYHLVIETPLGNLSRRIPGSDLESRIRNHVLKKALTQQ